MAAEFWNVLVALISGICMGIVLHSSWLHSQKRKEFDSPDLGLITHPDKEEDI